MSSLETSRRQEALLLGALFRGGHVPSQELAALSGISVSLLPERLSPYLKAGYPFEFHPERGIGLGDPPDIWCAEEILGRCPQQANLPAWDPLLLAETGSTNDVVREQARKGAKAGLVVAASRQSRGRGRLGRSWESPSEGGLYVSILLRPELPLKDVGLLGILASVAAVDAVEALSGLRPRIKWPNDLYLEGRKLGGLLMETEPRGGAIAWAVIGIGINVRQQSEDFSPQVRALATSLRLATGQLYRRADLLVALLHAFERRLMQPIANVREAWGASSLTLGQQITLTTLRGRIEGQALGLDESGALLLRRADGQIETVTAGDMQAV